MGACECCNGQPKYPEVAEVIGRHEGERGSLIPVLQEVQDIYGYLSEEVIQEIADQMHIPASNVYGVVTFYAQFHLTPRGRHIIRVCQGTACHVRGAAQILGEVEKQLGIVPGETTEDLRFTLEPVACLGCCGLAPVMVVDEDTHGRLTVESIAGILDKYE